VRFTPNDFVGRLGAAFPLPFLDRGGPAAALRAITSGAVLNQRNVPISIVFNNFHPGWESAHDS
jgi:hypothetical protein